VKFDQVIVFRYYTYFSFWVHNRSLKKFNSWRKIKKITYHRNITTLFCLLIIFYFYLFQSILICLVQATFPAWTTRSLRTSAKHLDDLGFDLLVRVYIAIHGYTWLYMAIHGYTWLYMAIHGTLLLFHGLYQTDPSRINWTIRST
jgi:mannose/fructose/N-acetylgalactosamine-specific phosphotransferase system component IIC